MAWLNVDMVLRDEGYKKEENVTIYKTEDLDKAREAENGSCELFKKAWGAVEMTEEDEKNNKQFTTIAVRRTTQLEDEVEKKGDVVLYFPKLGYLHLDITTSDDPEVLSYKEQNAKKYGLKLVEVHITTLRNALAGSEWDRDKLASVFHKAVEPKTEK